jgi:threonine dehydrogenase-like Zn-dependent dehydrogenase
MRALWLEDRRLTVRDDLPTPRPGPDEALVRVVLAGICGTDLELLRGYLPFRGVPGHEMVGVVVEAASAPHLVGHRVVAEINIACGDCAPCRSGLPRHCSRRRVLGLRGLDGVFAEHVCVPVANLQRVPDRVPDGSAVFTEPLAAARAAVDEVAPAPGTRVVLLGAGRLGQLIARVLATTGCRLTVVARHAGQRDLLASVDAEVVGEHETARLAGTADVVVEACGAGSGLATALDLVRPRGTVVLKTTSAAPVGLDLARVVVDEICLVGSRCGPFEPALALLAEGRVDPLPLIAATMPLEHGPAALERAAAPGAGKVLLALSATG